MAVFEGYKPAGSWIDRVDPRTKLSWLILITTAALLNSREVYLIFLILLIFAVSAAASVPLRIYLHPVLIVLVLALQMLVLQVLFSREGDVILSLGPLKIYSDAFSLAYTASLKIAVVVLTSVQFLYWTSPSSISLLLVKMKIPYRFAMLAGLALRFLPLMERELKAIMDSQAVRGLPTATSLQKIKALLPVSLPFLYRSFRRANETALAMELRGFGRCKTRTFLTELRMDAGETLTVIVLSALIIGQFWLKFGPGGFNIY